jgi:hypothetical protein
MNRRELLMGVAATAVAASVPVQLVYDKTLRTIRPIWTYSAFVKRRLPIPAGQLIIGQPYNLIFDGTDWQILEERD